MSNIEYSMSNDEGGVAPSASSGQATPQYIAGLNNPGMVIPSAFRDSFIRGMNLGFSFAATGLSASRCPFYRGFLQTFCCLESQL